MNSLSSLIDCFNPFGGLMMKVLKNIYRASFGLLAVLALSTAVNAAVETGKAAPDFTLTGHDGKTYKLSDYKGKHVVLEWFNDDCPFVVKHYKSKNMQKLQADATGKDVVWFTVVSSAPGKQGHLDQAGAKAMLAKHEAKATAMLLDPKGTVGRQFDAKTTPHMYVINPKGELVYQGAIDDNPSANIATVKTASPLFADALKASLGGKKIAQHTTKPYGCSVKY